MIPFACDSLDHNIRDHQAPVPRLQATDRGSGRGEHGVSKAKDETRDIAEGADVAEEEAVEKAKKPKKDKKEEKEMKGKNEKKGKKAKKGKK